MALGPHLPQSTSPSSTPARLSLPVPGEQPGSLHEGIFMGPPVTPRSLASSPCFHTPHTHTHTPQSLLLFIEHRVTPLPPSMFPFCPFLSAFLYGLQSPRLIFLHSYLHSILQVPFQNLLGTLRSTWSLPVVRTAHISRHSGFCWKHHVEADLSSDPKRRRNSLPGNDSPLF